MQFWWGHTYILLAFLVLLTLGPKRNIINWTWLYFIQSALWISFSPWFKATYRPELQGYLGQNAGQALFLAISLPLIVEYFREKYPYFLQDFCLAFTVVFNSIWVIFGHDLYTGTSFDTAIIALFVPGFLYRVRSLNIPHWWAPSLLPLAAILIGGGRTALLILFFQLALWAWFKGYKKFMWIFALAPVGVYLYKGKAFFNSSDRLMLWATHFDWWISDVNWFFGTGLGTYQWIGAFLPVNSGTRYVLMHNDWLQILFETGIIGFVLFCGFCVYFYRNSKQNWHKITLLSTGLCMTLYSPIHFLIVQIFLLGILLDIKTDTKQEI